MTLEDFDSLRIGLGEDEARLCPQEICPVQEGGGGRLTACRKNMEMPKRPLSAYGRTGAIAANDCSGRASRSTCGCSLRPDSCACDTDDCRSPFVPTQKKKSPPAPTAVDFPGPRLPQLLHHLVFLYYRSSARGILGITYSGGRTVRFLPFFLRRHFPAARR